MKNRSLRIVFLLFLAGFLSTCQKDVAEEEKLPPIDKQTELAAAESWYESNFGGLMLKSAVEEDSGRVVLKPEWKTAKIHHNRRLKTVETVLMPQDIMLFFARPENMQKYEETGDDRYLISLTRLVLQTHRRTGRQTGFMMTIMPSVKYLEQTEFNPFRKMAYIGRDKKFDGNILFHHTDGTFSNGWVYRNGKITHSINSTNREEEPVISLKSTGEWECTTYSQYGVYRQCWHQYNFMGDNWSYIGEYCSENTTTVLENEWTECVWIGGNGDDEFSDGDENSGSTDGGGPYRPPAPPRELVTVTVTANPTAGGSVVGGGQVPKGLGRIINATPNPGYAFVNWTGSTTVSTANYYIQAVNGDMTFTANFKRMNPCVQANDLANHAAFKGSMVDLKNKTSGNREYTILFKPNGTVTTSDPNSYIASAYEGNPNQTTMTMPLPMSKIGGMAHSHYGTGSLSIFSPGDLYAMYKLLITNKINDLSSFFSAVTTGHGTSYMLMIEDVEKFRQFGQNNFGSARSESHADELMSYLFRNLFGISPNSSTSHNEAQFLNFMKTANGAAGTGLTLFKSNSSSFSGWERLKMENNGNVVTNPCP
ncbi:MAG: hypothetical protein LBQ60_08075 [Bacteroidales bacterium]|jgi:hypothetical protein|nr:hypothetical protein [Bacteroidales bacterium]